jgi:hypothetical protein
LKPYGTPFWFWRRHKLSNSFEYFFELGVIPFFQSIKFSGETCMGREDFPQADKSPKNVTKYAHI